MKEQLDIAIAALKSIANSNAGECEKSTTGIGWCTRQPNMTPDGETYVSRWCVCCQAQEALNQIAQLHHQALRHLP